MEPPPPKFKPSFFFFLRLWWVDVKHKKENVAFSGFYPPLEMLALKIVQ